MLINIQSMTEILKKHEKTTAPDIPTEKFDMLNHMGAVSVKIR